MEKFTKPVLREIIDDFVKEVSDNRIKGPKPATWVIPFRNERQDNYEREVWWVPIDILRYRKNNGRIRTDVITYEKNCSPLLEDSPEAQKILGTFLIREDPERTKELKRLIQKDGQSEPAIITCDGFLINGNRRKVVFEQLRKEFPGEECYKRMKVVILPGKNDEGGPPTKVQIQELEHRLQLRREGKSEYSGINKALSMRANIEMGISLEQQLHDDPTFDVLPPKEFNNAMEAERMKYLVPLACVDRYLCYLGREDLYTTVQAGTGDTEGRWQAFIDYAPFWERLNDERKRLKLGINEDEVGNIEDAAFKIIRARELPGLPKAHDIMRKLPQLMSKKNSKEELFKLVDIKLDLPKEYMVDANGEEKDHREIDKFWRAKNQEKITRHVKKAREYYEYKKEKETPVILLGDALKKLNHDDMHPESVAISELQTAMQLAEKIAQRADELKTEFYRLYKNVNKIIRNSEIDK